MENRLDLSCEPMEVDLSNNSSRMDISFNSPKKEVNGECTPRESETPLKNIPAKEPEKLQDAVPIVKKYHINIQRNVSKGSSRKWFTSVIIVAIAILSLNIASYRCKDKLDITTIKETLSANLYGQDNAIEQIIQTLEASDKVKILFLYGGTGVGKTYSVSLMMQNMWNSLNVYHFTTSSSAENFSFNSTFGMVLCKNSIVVVDDLNTKNVNIRNTIKDIVAKNDAMNNEVLIILIYNCDFRGSEYVKKCDNSFVTALDIDFSEVKGLKKFIHFKELKTEHLKKCIENELGSEKYKIQDFDNFVKNFDVKQDGCKGVHTKMKLLKIL